MEQSLRNKTAKGLLWGMYNNGAQLIISTILGLILLNKLSPGDYGIVGMLTIFTAIATTLQECGLSAALTNRKTLSHDDHNAVFWFSLIVSVALYALLYASAPLIARFYGHPELVQASRVLFLSFLIGGLKVSQQAYLFRKMMVRERAIMDIISALVSGVVAVVLALRGLGYWVLIIHSLLQTIINTLLKVIFTPWYPTFNITFQPIKEMFSYGIKLVIASIVVQVQNNIFSVILGRFSNKVDVGYYSQGTKWSQMGNQVFQGMIGSVAQPVFADTMEQKKRQLTIFRKLCRLIGFMAFPAMLGLAFVAPEFINIINPEFNPAVPILQIYCVYFIASIIQSLYSTVTIAYGRSDMNLWYSVVNAVLQIAIAFLTYSKGIYVMAFYLMVTNYLSLLIWHFMAKDIIGVKFFHLVKDFTPYLIITIFVLLATYFITKSITNLYILLCAKIIVAVALYLLVMKLSEAKIFKECVNFLRYRNLE